MFSILFLAEIWLKLQSDFEKNLTCEKIDEIFTCHSKPCEEL